MRVPDFVLKGSAFLVSIAGDTGGDLEHDFVASGFFVAVASPNQPNRHYDYFVTAAHSLRDYFRYGIRVNLWGGGIAVIPVERWCTHPNDPQADVAIAEFLVKPEYDLQLAHEPLFRPRDQMKAFDIGIGDEVYFPGLFTYTQQESDPQNLPILRMGNIAMLPEGKVRTEIGWMDAYLVEGHSIGGISGAPVFSRRTISLIWNDMLAGDTA